MTEPLCPNWRKHSQHPEGYLAYFAWVERKYRTHEPVKCPECGLFAIWGKRAVPLTKAQVEAIFYPPDMHAVVVNVDLKTGRLLP